MIPEGVVHCDELDLRRKGDQEARREGDAVRRAHLEYVNALW